MTSSPENATSTTPDSNERTGGTVCIIEPPILSIGPGATADEHGPTPQVLTNEGQPDTDAAANKRKFFVDTNGVAESDDNILDAPPAPVATAEELTSKYNNGDPIRLSPNTTVAAADKPPRLSSRRQKAIAGLTVLAIGAGSVVFGAGIMRGGADSGTSGTEGAPTEPVGDSLMPDDLEDASDENQQAPSNPEVAHDGDLPYPTLENPKVINPEHEAVPLTADDPQELALQIYKNFAAAEHSGPSAASAAIQALYGDTDTPEKQFLATSYREHIETLWAFTSGIREGRQERGEEPYSIAYGIGEVTAQYPDPDKKTLVLVIPGRTDLSPVNAKHNDDIVVTEMVLKQTDDAWKIVEQRTQTIYPIEELSE